MLFVAVAIGMFMSVAAVAQVTTSSLNGHVADEAGEPLIGAAVVAVHTPSGTQYAAVANEEGRFVINGMRSGGPYRIEVSYIGMSTIEYTDVVLKLGEPYELNAVMTASNELDAVVVVSEKSFNSSITGAGGSFSLKSVEDTPTIDRSIYDVVKYTPQATLNKNGGISFAGTNNRYNSFQIDGAIANDAFGLSSSGTNGGQTGANPVSLDAIEEIQVVVAPFDVRQSGFTGGAINAVTKSGTNTVKGSFYSYFNNQDFLGTTPGKLEEGQTREKYDTQNTQTYGFTVGAPIIKDKLFIFASAEYYRTTHPNIYSPANGSYDSRSLAEPVTWNGNTYNNFTSDLAAAMIEKYNQRFGMNVSESYSQHQVTDQSINALARIDWNINDRNKLMVRYQFMDAEADQYGSFATGYYFNNSSYKQSNNTNTVVVELNSRPSDIVSNEFRATAVFVRDHRSVPYAGPNIYIDSDNGLDIALGTEYSSGANKMNSDTYTITDNVSIFKGNHNITIGTHNEIFRFYNVFLQYAYGGYTYDTLSDFFSDNVYQFNYRYSDPALTDGDTRWGATTWAAQFGLYAQDEWKPNNNFTLTYGLRLDMPLLLNKPTANDEFNATEIATSNNQYVGTVPKASVLFSPRVGFRWYIDKAHNSLLRGGAGLFTGRVPFVWLSNAYNNTGMEAKSVSISGNALNGIPFTSDPYADIIESGFASAGGRATINTLSRDFKYPQVFRVNIGYEQLFGHGWKFIFDALYSKTFNNVFFKNLALTQAGTVYAVNPENATATNTAPYYSVDGTYYAVVALQNTNKGYTYSLSGKIEKSFDFGLDLMASYTFGHSYSVNDGTSSVAYSNWRYNYAVDTNSPELSYSLFDRPHKVNAMISYTSPMYARMQTTVSLSYEGGSGQRFSYTMSESADFNGDGNNGNSLLYVPTQEEIGQMSWTSPSEAAEFEQFIRNDKYLNSHRGQWTERYAGIGKFENHFNLHVAQDFFYDRKHGRKIQVVVDFLNISNLFNREWGIYYAPEYNLQMLTVNRVTDDGDGNYTPTYSFGTPGELTLDDFYSRWRCQLGLRLTF